MNAKDQHYARVRLQTQREFAFWHGVFATPPGGRTRAQRRHIQTRQTRGRLLALEVVAKGRNQMALVPTPSQLFKPAEPAIDADGTLRIPLTIPAGVLDVVLDDPRLDEES